MRSLIRMQILEPRKGQLYIAGNIPNYSSKSERLYAVNEKGQEFSISPRRASAADRPGNDGKKPSKGYLYDIYLPMYAGAVYSFFCIKKEESCMLSPRFGKYSRLSDLDGSYFIQDSLLICTADKQIKVLANNLAHRLSHEHKYQKSLKENCSAEILKLRDDALHLRKKSKPIWIISDRSDAASDNGEAFFEYLLRTDAPDKYDIYFLISESSPDYERMRKIGPVIGVGTYEHLVKYLAASIIVSSSADEWMRNPFGSDRKYYRDMISAPYVFLQHGVIKDDLSDWLFILKKNLHIFITSTKAEWESIARGNYGYDESVVKLTGLARYDKLTNHQKKTIAILPTWRKSVASDLVPGTSERPYSDSFRDSDYFRFYNTLINDPALISAMHEHGYTGTFYLHPSHRNQFKDFSGNDTITVWKDLIPFSKVFSENSLLVTDYSSVAIDFAYLGKPVIYAQFDKEDFYASHSYVQGYYDYDTDGFGPVCYSYEKTVASIIECIESDCREPDIYRERVDRFFAFRDTDNSKRIYEEILRLLN